MTWHICVYELIENVTVAKPAKKSRSHAPNVAAETMRRYTYGLTKSLAAQNVSKEGGRIDTGGI